MSLFIVYELLCWIDKRMRITMKLVGDKIFENYRFFVKLGSAIGANKKCCQMILSILISICEIYDKDYSFKGVNPLETQ